MDEREPSSEFHWIANSAFGFLLSGIAHMWEGRGPDALRHAAIDFFTAIDLLLKARLSAEHWAFVIADAAKADRAAYRAGEAATVSLAQAADRLARIAEVPVPKEAFAAFEALRHTRNKAAIFRTPEDIDPATTEARRSELARLQLAGWTAMRTLLVESWKDRFAGFEASIRAVDEAMAKHRRTVGVGG